MTKNVVVVDPYSGSRGFATAFAERGYATVAVLSDPAPLASYAATWHPEEFAAVHCFDGDLDGLVSTVAGYRPLCIVPGNEHAVELTAALVDALLPGTGNVPGSAPAQRHKGEMAAALARAGVPGPRTICTDDAGAVQAWIRDSGLEGRSLVLKPPKSGGTEDVHRTRPGEDWRPHFDRVLGAVNMFDIANDQVVVQEYLEGTEFIVDLYSVDGRHGVVDVCRYRKHDRGDRIGIYDAAVFVPPDDPDVPPLVDYVVRAADAVGIRNGSTHAEVKLTPDGPRLVEIAGRLSGSCMMIAGKLATGDCQIDRTVRHHVDGDFRESYELVRHARTMWIGTGTDGILRNIEVLERAIELPTVHSLSLVGNGSRVSRTVDAFTELGWIILAGTDEAAVEADYQRIKELERQVVVEPVGTRRPA